MNSRLPDEVFQSLAETHERPFVVLNQDFVIVAVNPAYERAYGASRKQMIGRHCYEVSHQNDKPCFEYGEECPHECVTAQNKPHTCLHVHVDEHGRSHRVKIRAYPLVSSEGETYIGEAMEELSAFESHDSPIDTDPMVGRSMVFLRTLEQLKLAALSDVPVLLQGETGTGKELAANHIHRLSGRSTNPQVTLDCTVLTEPLFESEVFGHEPGSFTGSTGKREGLLELAHGGTLFLDEIGELSGNMQAKLLRVLESGEFRRVGGRTQLHVNARIICATNRDLGPAIDAGEFRADLFYRVAAQSIRLPCLRERMEDVPLIANAMLDRIRESTGQRYAFSAGALAELQHYEYPGNIRELRNVISVAAANSPHGDIRRATVVEVFDRLTCCRTSGEPPQPARRPEKPLDSSLSQAGSSGSPGLPQLEANHLAELLATHDGNRRLVAKSLGVSERTVYRKLKRYGLK